MADHSFFNLAPHNNDRVLDDPHLDWCASMSEAEHDAMFQEALDLGDHLHDAIDTYCEEHPHASYGLVIEALRYVLWSIEQQMIENNADA